MPPKTDAFHTTNVLNGRQSMPEGSFLRFLPADIWRLFVTTWGSDARVYERDKPLPLGQDDCQVYIVLGGCVVQERFPYGTAKGDPRIARFRGVGELLGEAKLIDPGSSVRTVCLSTTWVMPCPVRRMNYLLGEQHEAQLALLRSLEARNRADEAIYGIATRSPVQRVGGLLLHLAAIAGTKAPAGTKDPACPEHVTIRGATQKDVAEALLMGKSTVENAVRRLKAENVITSRYRQFVITDVPALKGIVKSP